MRPFTLIKTVLLIALSALISQHAFAKETIVKIQQPESEDDVRPKYYKELLHLAMEQTVKTDGPFQIQYSKIKAQQGRNIKSVISGKGIDVIWTMTSTERESQMLPIRVPLLKGMLGHRVCLIRAGTADKFKNIKTLADLQQSKLKLGSGHDWPDTKILKAAKLKVFTGADYQGLFKMLTKKRFDCYARGLNEAWAEKKVHKESNFDVDPNIAIVYRSPIYYFVNKKANKLAERIEKGLRLAIKDGSFDKIFNKFQSDYLKTANLKSRTIIHLDNPIMPKETPVKEDSLWLPTFSQKVSH